MGANYLTPIQLDENGQIIPTLQGQVAMNMYNNLVDKTMNYIDQSKENLETLPRDNQLNNLGLGLAQMGMPYVDMVRHPLDATKGIGNAIMHLPTTAKNMVSNFYNGLIDYYNPQNVLQNMYEDPAYPLRAANDAAAIALGAKIPIDLTKGIIDSSISKAVNNPNIQFGHHGSPYGGVKKFDQSKAGTGEKANVHGSGAAYNAKREDIADIRYAKRLSEKKGTKPHLYKTIYPSNEFMLDEKAVFKDQPKVVRESIQKMANEGNLYAKDFIDDDFINGKEFYNNLSGDFATKRRNLERRANAEIARQADIDSMVNDYTTFKNNLLNNAISRGINVQDVMNQAFGEGTNLVEDAWNKFKNNPNNYRDYLAPTSNYINKGFFGDFSDLFERYDTTIQDQLDASNQLRNAGVKGIQYIGETDGAANVIFDPSDIRVLGDKYGNWYDRLKYNVVDWAHKKYAGQPTGGAASPLIGKPNDPTWGTAGSSTGDTAAGA